MGLDSPVRPPPPLTSFTGFRSRTLMSFLTRRQRERIISMFGILVFMPKWPPDLIAFDWFLRCLLCNRNFGEFIAYPNIGNRRATGYRTKVLSRQSRRANVYEVGIASTQCLSWRDYL